MSEQSGWPRVYDRVSVPVDEALARPLRFAILGGSVVSEVDNPAATTMRLLMTELQRQGHDAVFLEPRNNPTMQAMLQTRGAAGLRAFGSRWPSVHYRSIDIPDSRRPGVWVTSELARLVATADVAIVLDTAPAVVRTGFGRMAHPRLVRVLYRTRDILPDEAEQYAMLAEPIGVAEESAALTTKRVVRLGPATSPTEWLPEQVGANTTSVAILAYDEPDRDLLGSCLDELISQGYVVRTKLALGTWAPHGWERIVESELPDRLTGLQAAVVIPGSNDQHTRSLAQARIFIPFSQGVRTIALGSPPDYPLLHDLGLLWPEHRLAPLERPIQEVRHALPVEVHTDTQVHHLRAQATAQLRDQLRTTSSGG